MRSIRRGRHSNHDFGGSGEDSFVAVVVTKLTGALLFILLLTMTILVLIPRADQVSQNSGVESVPREPLRLTLAEELPEAIVGRPYHVTLAVRGGSSQLNWSTKGELPVGLVLDPASGQLNGTPGVGSANRVSVEIEVTDGRERVSQLVHLSVLEPTRVLGWVDATKIRPVASWRNWLDHGFGFLVLGLVGILGLNLVSSIERWTEFRTYEGSIWLNHRFQIYRAFVCLSSIGLAVALGFWLFRPFTSS